jgi:flagellar hook-associated protein FlgK
MLSHAFGIGVSGVQTAQKVVDMLSHNIANVDTQGYKRLENHNYEINFSGPDNKPFNPAGVGTNISSSDYPWLDTRMNDALTEKAEKDAMLEGADEVARVAADTTLSESFTAFMNATQDLMANPNDQVYKEMFHQTGEAFTSQMNRVDKAFADVSTSIQEKISYNQMRMDQLQSQMADITKNPQGEASITQMNFLKQQLAQVTGSIAGYNKVLSNIIPPVTSVYNAAKADVIQGTNSTYGKDLITPNASGSGHSWNRIDNGDIDALTEFGSQQFNKDMGRAATVAGALQEVTSIDANFGANNLEGASSAYNAAYGVDLTDQATKLLQYQRIHEANTKVIQTADNMLGKLLDIFN